MKFNRFWVWALILWVNPYTLSGYYTPLGYLYYESASGPLLTWAAATIFLFILMIVGMIMLVHYRHLQRRAVSWGIIGISTLDVVVGIFFWFIILMFSLLGFAVGYPIKYP